MSQIARFVVYVLFFSHLFRSKQTVHQGLTEEKCELNQKQVSSDRRGLFCVPLSWNSER